MTAAVAAAAVAAAAVTLSAVAATAVRHLLRICAALRYMHTHDTSELVWLKQCGSVYRGSHAG
jgi:hypothetical protein